MGFGTCSDTVEVTHTRDIVTVTMPSLDASRGMVAFDYGGKQITERLLGLRRSGVSGDSADVWIGRSAYAYLTAPENDAALVALMGWEALDAARNASAISSDDQALSIDGNWLVASGCQPHSCNTSFTAIALHRESGKPLVALKLEGRPAELLREALGKK